MQAHLHLIAASILSADIARQSEELYAVIAAGADWIHFDVLDNPYVPNLSFGPAVAAAPKPPCERPDGRAVPLEVHLRVEPVDALAQAFAEAAADPIGFHPEASRRVDRTLQPIRAAGCRSGLVSNPTMPLGALDRVLDRVDVVLRVSVNPGFGSLSCIDGTLAKRERSSASPIRVWSSTRCVASWRAQGTRSRAPECERR